MRVLPPALTYFAWVFGAGFVLGVVRVTWLVPRIGERIAELTEMPLMFIVIVLAARWVVRRFALRTRSASLATGIGAVVLLLLAELTFAVVLQARPLIDYIASRDPVSGSVYLALLLLMALLPWLLVRRAACRGVVRGANRL
ncbi:MAG: hypothetical protein KDG44_19760 [Burkholderiaceae bacterium]|nr:hypothetical protein [Burkholderiaceae bacterium]